MKTQLIVSFEVQELAKESMEYMNVRIQKFERGSWFKYRRSQRFLCKGSQAGLGMNLGDYHDAL